MTALQIDQDTFKVISKLSSWAVCCFPEAESNQLHPSGLSNRERESLGYKCKAGLNLLRTRKLEQIGFSVSLRDYISSLVTLENKAICAKINF